MSTWDRIVEALKDQALVEVELSEREVLVCAEALNNWADSVLAEAPAWDVAQLMTEWDWPWKKSQQPAKPSSSQDGTKAIKGLDPREVQLIRHFRGNAKSKQGETGDVVALPPKEWERIKKEIEAQPDYYDKMLGNIVSAKGLTKKIGDQLSLAMGPQVRSEPADEPVDVGDLDFDGEPSEPTPVIQGSDQFKTDPRGRPSGAETPAASPEKFAPAGTAKPKRSQRAAPASPPAGAPGDERTRALARRKRVAAQDAAMMGGKTTPVGRVKVK